MAAGVPTHTRRCPKINAGLPTHALPTPIHPLPTLTAGGFVEVYVDTLQLEVGVALVGAWGGGREGGDWFFFSRGGEQASAHAAPTTPRATPPSARALPPLLPQTRPARRAPPSACSHGRREGGGGGKRLSARSQKKKPTRTRTHPSATRRARPTPSPRTWRRSGCRTGRPGCGRYRAWWWWMGGRGCGGGRERQGRKREQSEEPKNASEETNTLATNPSLCPCGHSTHTHAPNPPSPMAALSLRCAECGAALKSVAEAQDHGEATGHSRFEESVEAVTQMVRERERESERGREWLLPMPWVEGGREAGGGKRGANCDRMVVPLSPHPPPPPHTRHTHRSAPTVANPAAPTPSATCTPSARGTRPTSTARRTRPPWTRKLK